MNVVSMFDGISCGRVALERAGIPVDHYVAYEIEPNAIKISKKNYPQIEHCGDVITADFTQYQGFDLLIGGSPCQSLSIVQSKTRENLDGKSKLFFEFVRAKEEMQPRWFLFENVASMNEASKQFHITLGVTQFSLTVQIFLHRKDPGCTGQIFRYYHTVIQHWFLKTSWNRMWMKNISIPIHLKTLT